MPYAHCKRYGEPWKKAGWLLTNLPAHLLPADLNCDGNCESIKLMEAWTGRRNNHCDHVFFKSAAGAASLRPSFANDIAIAALEARFA